MAVVYHEIYLPIDTESTFDYIVIKQGDAGTHRVRATLISNNRVYTIPTSGVSYYMKFRKPDNNYVLVQATVADNTISAEVTEEMLRVSGTGRGEFMIVSGSDELKTATFHVKIVKETFTSGDVQSHSDFAPFAALLEGAGAAASNANTAAAAATAAANLAQQKAEAIPDDYSDLVAEVEEVKADLGNLSNLETESKTDLVSAINEASKSGLSDDAKAALLACFENVGWKQGSGREYIDSLESALYPNLYPKITAIINQTEEVFDTDDLSSIRQYLTVKYFETSEDTGTTVTGYTLEGNLTIGISQVAIKYNGLRAVVSVTVTAFHSTPTFAIGAPYATASLFEYTPNAIRACMNPIAVYLPPGTYSIEHSAGSNYYFSLAVVKYDKSQYNPDFSFTEGTEKVFMTSGMSYAWPAFADGTNGWQNTSKTFTVLDAYTKMYLNLKKGTAGTDQFTSADIAALNGNIVFRRVSE